MIMKRSLSVAIVAATLATGAANAAENLQLGVSGALHNAFTVQDVLNDNAEYDFASHRSDNLVSLNGNTVLDNGLKVGAVASFSFALAQDASGSANGSQGNIYQEEIYANVGGSFGDVYLGRRRNAASLSHVFIPSVGNGTFAVDDSRMNAFIGGGTTTAVSLETGTEYANRIQYFTPRFEGLQLAASFTPDTDPNESKINGIDRYSGAFIQNEISGALNYNNEFPVDGTNNIGTAFSAGYTYGKGVRPGLNTGAQTGQDAHAWQTGLALSYIGFTLGGAYGELQSATDGDGRDRRYGIGLKYETGPWTFGGSYLQRRVSEDTDIVLQNGEIIRSYNAYELGGKYALGPGVYTGVGFYFNDNAEKTGGVKPTQGKAEDSMAGVANLSVHF
jgi:outer membrane protein OmpU